MKSIDSRRSLEKANADSITAMPMVESTITRGSVSVFFHDASSSAASVAPTPPAPISQPIPFGPASRIVSAKTGMMVV